jgi:hypothetical protein
MLEMLNFLAEQSSAHNGRRNDQVKLMGLQWRV